MNNLILKIKKIFKKKNVQQESNGINPHTHWIIILWTFSVVVISLIIFSLYILYKVKNDEIFQMAPAVQENNKLIREDLLNKVTESFDNKIQKENELKTNPPIYKDPSL